MSAPVTTEIRLCLCGCGRLAPIAQRNRPERGHRRGHPVRYIPGHYRRRPPPAVEGVTHRCDTCAYPLWMSAKGRPPGFSPHVGRGLCGSCWHSAVRADELADHERATWSRDDLMDEWDRWRAEGWTRVEFAEWAGLSPASFDRQLFRAKRDGDPRAVLGTRRTA